MKIKRLIVSCIVLIYLLSFFSFISCSKITHTVLQKKNATIIMDVLVQSDQSMIVLGMTDSPYLPANSGRPDVDSQQNELYGFVCSMSADMQIQWLHYLSPVFPGRGLSLTQDQEFNILVVHTQKLQSQEKDNSFGLFISTYAYDGTFLQRKQISNYAVQSCESFVFDPTMERLYGVFSPENFDTIGSFSTVESVSENLHTEPDHYFLVCLSYEGDMMWHQKIFSAVTQPTNIDIQCSFDSLRVYIVMQKVDPIEAHRAITGIMDPSNETSTGDVLCFSSGGELVWPALTKPRFGGYVHSVTEDASGTVYCLHTKKKMAETESHTSLYITAIDTQGQMQETYLSLPLLSSPVSFYPAMHLVYNSATDRIYITREPYLSPLSPSLPQTLFVGELSKDFQSFVWSKEYFVTKPTIQTHIHSLNCDQVKVDSSGNLLIVGRLGFRKTESISEDESATDDLKILPAMFENMPKSRYLTWDNDPSFLLRVSKRGEPLVFTFVGGNG